MTAKDIYALACSFLYEKPGQDAAGQGFYLGFLNLLLAESLPIENSIRLQKGLSPLPAAPVLSAETDVVHYDDAIARIALPYGLASWFFQDIADNVQAENYRAKYIGALRDAAKARFVPIEDAYGGE
ncbi:MAG: hypothetical protein ACOYIR_02345 [Christensenellales bacterium]|jgi:hypothetical protein